MKKRLLPLAILAGLAIIATSFIYQSGTTTSSSGSADEANTSKEYIYSFVKATDSESGNPQIKVREYAKSLEESHRFTYENGSVYKWTHHNNQIWAIDDISNQVIQMSAEGEVLNTYGQLGDAPWEGRSLTQLDVDDEGFYTADNTLMILKKMNFDDEMEYYHKEKRGIWDGIRLKEDKFLVVYTDGEFQFETIDVVSGEHSHLINFTDAIGLNRDMEYADVAFEGYTVKGSNDRVYYICSKAGVFLAFNGDGSLAYHNTTIDGKAPPVVSTRVMDEYTFFIKEPDYSSNYAACADDNYLYILSLIAFEKREELSIDIYDQATGRYSHSMSVPNLSDGQMPTRIMVVDDLLYALYEEQEVVAYHIQDPQA